MLLLLVNMHLPYNAKHAGFTKSHPVFEMEIIIKFVTTGFVDDSLKYIYITLLTIGISRISGQWFAIWGFYK